MREAGLRVWVVALLLPLLLTCCRRFRNEFEPNENNGVVQIVMPDAPPGFSYSIYDPHDKHRFWYATKLPARVSLPYDTPVLILADAPGYHPFLEVISVSREQRSLNLDVVLKQSTLLFCVTHSEIPRVTGFVSLDVPVVGTPGQPVFRIISYSSVMRQPTAPDLVIDDQARVWHRSLKRAGEYWQLGQVATARFARVRSLCQAALRTSILEEPTLGDDFPSVVEAECNARVLAYDIAQRGRRQNAAALELLAWLDAVEFEARGALGDR